MEKNDYNYFGIERFDAPRRRSMQTKNARIFMAAECLCLMTLPFRAIHYETVAHMRTARGLRVWCDAVRF